MSVTRLWNICSEFVRTTKVQQNIWPQEAFVPSWLRGGAYLRGRPTVRYPKILLSNFARSNTYRKVLVTVSAARIDVRALTPDQCKFLFYTAQWVYLVHQSTTGLVLFGAYTYTVSHGVAQDRQVLFPKQISAYPSCTSVPCIPKSLACII
jgi:hypothetical protein